MTMSVPLAIPLARDQGHAAVQGEVDQTAVVTPADDFGCGTVGQPGDLKPELIMVGTRPWDRVAGSPLAR